MKTNRPKIDVPLEPLDVIIDITSIMIYTLMIIYTVISYSDLADTIPTHFNASGEADGFGDKATIWILPVIGIVIYSSLFVLNKYPHAHNYMVNITEDNAFKNYRLSTRLVRFTNLFLAIIFAFIHYVSIEKGKGNAIELGSWFTPIIIGISIISPLFIIVYQQKINKS